MDTRLETRLDTAGQQIDAAGLTAFLGVIDGIVFDEKEVGQRIIRIVTPHFMDDSIRYHIMDYAVEDRSLLITATLDQEGSVLSRGPRESQRPYLQNHRLGEQRSYQEPNDDSLLLYLQ